MIFFKKDVAKGHLLGGDLNPRSSNIYMNEMCVICEEYLTDGKVILRYENDERNIVICEECAYFIHCGYEANL